MLEIKAKRRLVNRIGNSRMINLPSYMLDNMKVLDCEYAFLIPKDSNHIEIEFIREERKEIDNDPR
jgi:hypothetical protein